MKAVTVPAREGYGEYEEKHSRFLGYCYAVSSESEVSTHLAALRKEHFEARHVVSAFILADGTARFSDDGEPHGTAGKPLMSVLEGSGLSDCLVAVVRYFGGTLLGTGGLVRAYTAAASQAVEAAGSVRMVPLVRARLTCRYDQFDTLSRLLETQGAFSVEAAYTDTVSVTYSVSQEKAQKLSDALTERFAGTLVPEIVEKMLGKDENP